MKMPEWAVAFKVDLYALKEYRSWTDEELGKRLGVTARTIRSMRRNPSSVNGGLVLRKRRQELREQIAASRRELEEALKNDR